MKKISLWAKHHKWQSRILIGLIYVLINLFGLLVGKWLGELGIVMPTVWIILFLCVTILAWIIYPQKGKKNLFKIADSYVIRKSCDFALGLSTFILIIYVSNSGLQFIQSEKSFASIPVSRDTGLINHPLMTKFKEEIKKAKGEKLSNRQKIHLIKKQLRIISKSQYLSDGDKTALIILSIIVAIALLFGLSVLSCSIMCSGSEALAAVVLLLGTVLIIVLLVKVIKRITKGPKQSAVSSR